MPIQTRLAVRKARNRREKAGRKEFVGVRRLPGGREIKLVVTKRRADAVQRTIVRANQGGGSVADTGGGSTGGYNYGGAGSIRDPDNGGRGGREIIFA